MIFIWVHNLYAPGYDIYTSGNVFYTSMCDVYTCLHDLYISRYDRQPDTSGRYLPVNFITQSTSEFLNRVLVNFLPARINFYCDHSYS